jgi:hypothetical protein
MPTKLKILLGCLATALLTVGAVTAMVEWEGFLYRNGFHALVFFSQNVPDVLVTPTIYLYDTIRFAFFGSLAALLMLLLKPRQVWLYAFVSACALYFYTFMGMAFASKDTFSIVLAITWIITIPVLYALFVRLSENRHNKSFNSDAGKAGAG